MRDESLKYKTFSRRAIVIGGIKLFFFSVIASRYYYLQMVTSNKFTTLSDKNRLKMIILTPPRGVIYDCRNEVIATNSSNFRIGIDSLAIQNVTDIVNRITKILDSEFILADDELKKKIAKRQPNDYLYLMDNLKWNDVNKLIESDHLLPGVDIIESSHRNYTHGVSCAHITGYVSTPNKDEIKNLKIPISDLMKVGKIGIEKIFDSILRGAPGLKKTEVDARGKLIRTLDTEAPIPGQNLTLTINVKLQKFVHELLTDLGLTASVVVMNAKNGEVLTLHSVPSYDPNLFVNGITKSDWQAITNTESNPLINHVISSSYPPGSTFKLVTAFAALHAGFDPTTFYFCSGEFKLGSRIFKCWKASGHGNIDLSTAIPQSCNPYFYRMASKIGINKLCEGAALLGIGKATGIELYGEINGLMPSPEWKKKRFDLDWYPGDTVNASIGQGYTLLTPLQIATMTARIASGNSISPHVIMNADSPEALKVNPSILKVIRDGMYNCLNNPKGLLYSRDLSIGNFQISGKTGTAQVVSLKHKNLGDDFKHHGLFTSFAPYDDPKFVVTVVVEHGGSGSKVSPISKSIYNFMLENGIA